jgi:hypothetical protein
MLVDKRTAIAVVARATSTRTLPLGTAEDLAWMNVREHR